MNLYIKMDGTALQADLPEPAQLLEELHARGISDRALATTTGISASSLCRIRQGKTRNPGLEQCRRILEAYGACVRAVKIKV